MTRSIGITANWERVNLSRDNYMRAVSCTVTIERDTDIDRKALLQPRPMPQRRQSVSERNYQQNPRRIRQRRSSFFVRQQDVTIDNDFRNFLDRQIEQTRQIRPDVEITLPPAEQSNSQTEQTRRDDVQLDGVQLDERIRLPQLNRSKKAPFTKKGRKPSVNMVTSGGNLI